MPNQITPATFEDAINETVTTAAQADMPLFGVGDFVFKLSSLPTSGSGAALPAKLDIRQTVLSIQLLTATATGTTVPLDQTRAYGTPADGSTARTYTGWQHTTATPAATVAGTTISRPWFYQVQDRFGSISLVHQADITNQAAVETYVAANFAAMWP